jgi:hypothetical protein
VIIVKIFYDCMVYCFFFFFLFFFFHFYRHNIVLMKGFVSFSCFKLTPKNTNVVKPVDPYKQASYYT